MCGVFGYVSENGRRPNLKRLAHMARVTERRGRHAFGLSWIDSRGRLRMFKQTGRISDHLGVLAMAADAQMLIGHCRYATAGDPDNNLNNHPHPADGGWIVHNGTLPNYADLVREHGLAPVSACDTEALGLLIEQADGTLAQRCDFAVAQVDHAPAVLLGLWTHPRRLIAVRSGNPLRMGRAGGGLYLASLREGLPRSNQPVPDDVVMEFRFNPEGACNVQANASTRTWPAALWS